MDNQKPWDNVDLEDDLQDQPEPETREPKYQVLKRFSHGRIRVNPGDEMPKDISDIALASLLRKGVVKAL